MQRLASVWTVTATQLPRVLRRCPRCDAVRPFVSSGKFRVNAQKRRLDVWLVHRCADCDETWNAPIHERVTPESLGAALDAYHGNDPDAARRCAWAVPGADRRVAYTVAKEGPEGAAAPVAVTLRLPDPIDVRLDRLIARELGLPRAEVSRMLGGAGGRAVDGQVVEQVDCGLRHPPAEARREKSSRFAAERDDAALLAARAGEDREASAERGIPAAGPRPAAGHGRRA